MFEILAVLGLPLAGAALLAVLGHRPVAPSVNVAASFATFLAALLRFVRADIDADPFRTPFAVQIDRGCLGRRSLVDAG